MLSLLDILVDTLIDSLFLFLYEYDSVGIEVVLFQHRLIAVISVRYGREESGMVENYEPGSLDVCGASISGMR